MKSWLPVLVWVLVIFSASADSASGQHSSRIIGPIIRWFYPPISPQALENAIYLVRKTAHLTEYAVLAILLWRALRKPPPFTWSWHTALAALVLAALYALTDELHQSLVPNREASAFDVVLDTCGAALGLALVWLILKVKGLRSCTSKSGLCPP